MALYITVYMSLMGKQGLKEVNEIGYSNAHYLAEQLCKTGKFELAYPDKPFLNEFVIKVKGSAAELQHKLMLHSNAQFGLRLDDSTLLLCTTEMQTKADIDNIIAQCANII